MPIPIGASGVERPAIFFDRDGTLIEPIPYLQNPSAIQLVEGATKALAVARGASYTCVLVTNQSAVGRGLISEARLEEIHCELQRQLKRAEVELDAIYYSTIVPRTGDRTIVEHPDRKPGPGLLLRAASELGLSLARSWMVGDMISDVLAGVYAGCQGCVWIGAPEEERVSVARDAQGTVILGATSLLEAVEAILLSRKA